MITIFDWMQLLAAWMLILSSVAGLFVAADWWSSRHDVG